LGPSIQKDEVIFDLTLEKVRKLIQGGPARDQID